MMATFCPAGLLGLGLTTAAIPQYPECCTAAYCYPARPGVRFTPDPTVLL